MSSSQIQMEVVKGAKKISAKEKFAAAQAAKMAKKAEDDASIAKKEAMIASEKAKQDEKFAKEKKKVAKENAIKDSFMSVFRSYVMPLTKDERVMKLSDVRRQIADMDRENRASRIANNSDSYMVGKDSVKYDNLHIMMSVLNASI